MNIKNNKGVTLIVLTITIIVLIIITSIVIYNAKTQLSIKYLNNLYSDIDSIETKVSAYYLEFGDLPVYKDKKYAENKGALEEILGENGADRSNVITNVNDSGAYYVVDLTKLDNLTLNYGKGYTAWGEASNPVARDNLDVYVINSTTHQIYYPHGIALEGTHYFSKDLDDVIAEKIDLEEKADNWTITINNISKNTTQGNKVMLNANIVLCVS